MTSTQTDDNVKTVCTLLTVNADIEAVDKDQLKPFQLAVEK